MVSRETSQRKTMKTARKKRDVKLSVVFSVLFVLILAFVVRVVIFINTNSEVAFDTGGCPTIGGEIVNSDECESGGTVSKIKPVDFQPVVDEFVSSVGGEKGIIIYDLDLSEVVGAYNPDERMRIESIYKLFVVYEGYRRVNSGEWDGEDACGYTGWTIQKCLDKAVRDSSSTAAEALHVMIGYDELNTIVNNEFGLPDVVVESISATPREVMQMMKIFYEHAEIKNSTLVELMKDSFLNQPPSAGYCDGLCDWRRGLPSGFSENVNVYNKVGWLASGSGWLYYCDAAIVEFPSENRHFIVVVLTSNVSNKAISDFGASLEDYLLR